MYFSGESPTVQTGGNTDMGSISPNHPGVQQSVLPGCECIDVTMADVGLIQLLGL